MSKFDRYQTETKAWIIAKPLLAVAIGIAIGFFFHMLLF